MLYMYSFVLHRSYLLFFFAGLKAHANGRNKSQHRCVLTLLGVFGEQCCIRLYGPKSLTDFKLYATSANIVVVPCKRTQHVGPNNVACYWSTMLRPFA